MLKGLQLFHCTPKAYSSLLQSHQMDFPQTVLLIMLFVFAFEVASSSACSDGGCKLLDRCSSDEDCAAGLYCHSCLRGFGARRCVRSTFADQFKLLNDSLPFNKYAFLTTHNSFAIEGEASHTVIPRIMLTNQDQNITQQLNNGVRALMLDTYEFKGDVWLCHSFDGKCYDFTAFGPAVDTLKEVEAFLSANPSEIVTLILEDYVKTPMALRKVFDESGLMKYWFPVEKMPQSGQDWPLVKEMVAQNQRLIVFTSKKSKQEGEGIAYQWNYMVENQYGDEGMKEGSCSNRAESAPLNDTSKSLVLVNHFRSFAVSFVACNDNSENLTGLLQTCYRAAGNRWANFLAVDYYERSKGGGAFQAIDALNGKLLCGCSDVHACVPGAPSEACSA